MSTDKEDELIESINEQSQKELLLGDLPAVPKPIARCMKCNEMIISDQPYVIKSIIFINTNNSGNSEKAYFHNKKPCWG